MSKKRVKKESVEKASKNLLASIEKKLEARDVLKSAKPKRREKKVMIDTGEKPMSLLDAAAKVLAYSTGPMKCREIVSQAISSGYWVAKKGKTPDATLYSSISKEINRKGDESRFVKTGPGSFEKRRNN